MRAEEVKGTGNSESNCEITSSSNKGSVLNLDLDIVVYFLAFQEICESLMNTHNQVLNLQESTQEAQLESK